MSNQDAKQPPATSHHLAQPQGLATGARKSRGEFVGYEVNDIPVDASFLEMLDILNEQLNNRGEDSIAFESDCREGICGTCSLVIDGLPHGPGQCTTCQLMIRDFKDGATITVEPFSTGVFNVVKDLTVDRSGLDRVIQSGGYVTVHSGPKPEPNSIPVEHAVVEDALDASACIGCGACVAACPNGSASLFTSAKIGHLGLAAAGSAGAKLAGREHGGIDGRGGFRQLPQLRGMPGILPQGHLDQVHRQNERRLHQGDDLRW